VCVCVCVRVYIFEIAPTYMYETAKKC